MKLLTTIATLSVLALCSCSGAGADANRWAIEEAEAAADSGNFVRAITLCNDLLASPDTSLLSETEYCRVATIYAIAADNIPDNESAMIGAVAALNHALTQNADSVNIYINNLPVEKQTALSTPMQLIHNRGIDMSAYTDGEDIVIPDRDIDPDADTADTHEHSHNNHD